MRRIEYPRCDGCGASHPKYESEVWGTKVCYDCLRVCADWMQKNDVLSANPLVQELFDGVFSGGTVPQENQYTVVVKSQLGGNAYSFVLVDRIEKFSTGEG